MEDNKAMISSIKEEIKKIKLEIIEKMDKLDELLETIEKPGDVDF